MSHLEATIAVLRADLDGEVCSRSRVIDGLLDLRLAADDRADVVGMVDEALADAPGSTMVPAAWWRERLDLMELAAVNPVEPVG